MSTKRTLRAAFVSAALAWAASLSAAPDTADLAWIGRLPGLSLLTNKTTSTTTKTVYSVSADVDATVERVTKGLTERGWMIRKSTSTPVGGIAARSLTAVKDGARLKVAASDVMGVSHLTLTLRGKAGASAAAAAEDEGEEADDFADSESARAPATARESAPRGAGPLELADDRLEGRYDCAGRDVSIAGNRCRITLEGTCRTLKVLGESNRIVVDGSVQAIQTLGGRNQISWSAAKNPQRPKVTTLGSRNRVGPDDQQ